MVRKVIIGLIRLYQKGISPFLPPSCRFVPTCSTYAIQAFEKYGLLRGAFLTIKRISKCHPFHRGGFDPIP